MTINTLLYGGFLLIISGVILFIVSIIKLREIEREEFRNEQLHKAFMKARKIKKWYLIMNIRGCAIVRCANY